MDRLDLSDLERGQVHLADRDGVPCISSGRGGGQDPGPLVIRDEDDEIEGEVGGGCSLGDRPWAWKHWL